MRIAVIQGGPSAEAEVSRRSAAAVRAALASRGHQAVCLELDRALSTTLAASTWDVAFPVTHGPLGEDGGLQGLLEVAGLPYVGSGVLASALAASKPHAKAHFRAAGLPVAEEGLVPRGADLGVEAARLRREIGAALIVKPASGGSGIGVGRVRAADPDQVLVDALRAALADDAAALVERFVQGGEVTCGVLEDDAGVAQALPPTLVLAQAADWYDFTSRYAAGGSEHRCPPPFAPELIARIQAIAVGAHRALGARDLSRADFVVGDGDDASAVTLLEVNTLPGMTATSLFPEAAGVSGIPFAELCDRLAQRAAARPVRPAPLARALP